MTSPRQSQKSSFGGLVLGALGVVYGDIGTSPLYTLHECFAGEHPLTLDKDNILGVLSLIVWSLTIIVSIKYIIVTMRANNHGEGGSLALLALLHQVKNGPPWLPKV